MPVHLLPAMLTRELSVYLGCLIPVIHKRDLILLCITCLWVSSCSAVAVFDLPKDTRVDDKPAPTAMIDRLAVPELSADPSQLELGTFYYKQVCMACHGDFGQGLTEEWRQEWGEDYNCWNVDCHSASHPPWGFEIPRSCCPPVSGSGSLVRFETAADLYTYVVETMPWWNPGYRSAEEYWQVTAYLLELNQVLPAGVELDPGNAMVLKLRPDAPPPGDLRPFMVILVAVLAMAAFLVAIQNHWFYKSPQS